MPVPLIHIVADVCNEWIHSIAPELTQPLSQPISFTDQKFESIQLRSFHTYCYHAASGWDQYIPRPASDFIYDPSSVMTIDDVIKELHLFDTGIAVCYVS